MMRALSIKQPWAWLICTGYKDIENRDWHLHMPPLLNYRRYAKNVPMRIYVHAGKTTDIEKRGNGCLNERWILERLDNFQKQEYFNVDLTLGAIIGEVDITGCVDKSDSPWFVGKYGFVLANPVLYDKPIPCKGKLVFFEPNIPKLYKPTDFDGFETGCR